MPRSERPAVTAGAGRVLPDASISRGEASVPRRVSVVQHQVVAVGVREQGHVADARVEGVAGELDALCDQVIAANPDKVAEIKAGNEKLLNWLTGQVMKASTSKPNPKQVTDLLKGKLS